MKTIIRIAAVVMAAVFFMVVLGLMIPFGPILVSQRVMTPLDSAQNGIHVGLVKTVRSNVPGVEVHVTVDDTPSGYVFQGMALRVADSPVSDQKLEKSRTGQFDLSSVIKGGSNERSCVLFLPESDVAKAYLTLSFRRENTWLPGPSSRMRYLIPIRERAP